MTAGLAVTSCIRWVRVGLGVQSQICATVPLHDSGQAPSGLSVLTVSLHIALGGLVSRGRGAMFATDLKVDIERCDGNIYLSLFICVFVCLRACVFVCLRACVFVCLRACVFVCLRACVFVCLRACVFVCLRACVFVCLRACVCSLFFVCLSFYLSAGLSVVEKQLSVVVQSCNFRVIFKKLSKLPKCNFDDFLYDKGVQHFVH